MKRIIIIIALVGMAIAVGAIIIGCSTTSAGKLYGEAKPAGAVPAKIADLQKNPQDHSTVVLEGVISNLCQSAGCWMYLDDDSGRIYVEFLNFALPKDKIGAHATVWGNTVLTDKGEVKFAATGAEVR
jgi:uncharacterized protein YdeI (BOF family)